MDNFRMCNKSTELREVKKGGKAPNSSLKKRDDAKENTKSEISDYYQQNMLI